MKHARMPVANARLASAVFLAALVMVVTVPSYAEVAATPPAAVATTAAGATSDASAVVKNFYAKLVEAMKQGDKLGFSGRYKKLDPAVRSAFNLALMTRLAIGPVWANATPDEQKQLIAAFSEFSVANYASQFKAYDGEQFTVGAVKPASGGVIVETTLQPKDGDAVALNYLMRQDEKGAWRIVDVFLDGAVSEMAARRSEFTSIVKRDGIGALVNSLGEKTRQMGPS